MALAVCKVKPVQVSEEACLLNQCSVIKQKKLEADVFFSDETLPIPACIPEALFSSKILYNGI